MARLLKYILILLVLGALLAGGSVAALYWWFNQPRVTMQEADLFSPVLFEVPRGSNGRQLTEKLAAEGYIEHSLMNYVAARLFMNADHIRAGVYAVHPADSPRSIWQRVVNGQQHLFQMTFIEGSEFSQWRDQLATHDYLETVTEGLTDQDIVAMIDPDAPAQHPEGLFFPDTYRFTAGTTDLQLLRQAYGRMQQTLDELWAERQDGLPISAPYQALILASIVEKETGATHERGLVASVFVNRLHTGMRLQSDPTIIYGLGDDYRGVIYRSDINQYTPYNTYRINGLPPTPIAMPGYEAIRATLNPEQSDYFYFVSSNDGQHIFSRTLEEHNRAVYQYQRNQ
ncbi:endolytic transglycosylase MltG [Aliidiomarina sedimenti]|uniref:Endolytic murein transglycosylase n=1 Tax=Aliidiomarina sedimenti TaxID=1933879 RepID=A0ABY0C1V9_9GAMM|nr:endolytic transglycosylase MltG [Aliidiomarina sedimenti]RUO31730.1 endolytic transglycosylase MltG [Aliidiomarina sedimenti]